VTNTIDGLQKLGYVVRTHDEQDRRKWLAAITDQGREVAVLSTKAVNTARFGTAPLTQEQLGSLFDVLRTLRADEDGFGG
jgi:DNA-binding MarR family transcriptional regulator